jgi:hypothetical protein
MLQGCADITSHEEDAYEYDSKHIACPTNQPSFLHKQTKSALQAINSNIYQNSTNNHQRSSKITASKMGMVSAIFLVLITLLRKSSCHHETVDCGC